MQTGGGRHVSDANPSDDRLATHSNVRMAVLCRNFSNVAFGSRTLRQQEGYEAVCRRRYVWGREQERVEASGLSTRFTDVGQFGVQCRY